MAQNKDKTIILQRRSNISGSVPTTSTMKVGEIALNTYDGTAFIYKSGSAETIEQIVTTNSNTTGDINILGTGSFGEVSVQNDVNVSGSVYVLGDIVASGDVDIIGSVTASAFVGDGSKLTNLPTGSTTDVPLNDFDYIINDVSRLSDFNNKFPEYELDSQWQDFTGTPMVFVGGLRDSGSHTDILPTSASLDVRVDGDLVARFGKTTATLYGIGDVLAFSGSVAARLTAVEYGSDGGEF